jgi:hypothetical protein
LPLWTTKKKLLSFMQNGKWTENVGIKQKNYRSFKSKCKTNVFLCELSRHFEDKLRRFGDFLCFCDQEIKIRGTLERCS